MPIYEYRCKKCHHEFEVMQRMADDPLKDCPQCAEQSLEKLISHSSFQLKGTGWYQTDFKNPPAKTTTDTKSSDTKTTTEAT